MVKYLLSIKEAFNLKEKNNNTLYGYCGEYETTVYVPAMSTEGIVVYLNFFGDASVKEDIINKFINYEGKAYAGGRVNVSGVRLNLNGFTGASAAKKLIIKLRYIINYMYEQGIKGRGICPICGEEIIESDIVQLNDCYMTLDVKCATDIKEASAMAEKEFKEQPGNYFKGFLGSLIGAVVGAVVWFLLYYFLGLVSAWVGLLSVMLADFLYVKFEGKKDKYRVFISAATVLVLFELVCLVIWGLLGSAYAYSVGSNLSGLQYVLQDSELKGYFIYDMVMNLIYTGIGVAIQSVIINKKNKETRLKIK